MVLIRRLKDNARGWRHVAAVLAVTAVALLSAALVARAPPDFAELRVIAVLRDSGRHPAWAVRLARTAHQIAVDAIDVPAPPVGKAYQLWLVAPGLAAPHPLGLLPSSGGKIIPEAPTDIRRLTATGEMRVTLEPGNGGLAGAPSGAAIFRGGFGGAD